MLESFVHKQPSPLPQHPKRCGGAQFRYRRNRLLPFTARRPANTVICREARPNAFRAPCPLLRPLRRCRPGSARLVAQLTAPLYHSGLTTYPDCDRS